MDIATKACNSLGIPSPLEVMYLYNALGESAVPYEATQLYKLRPNGCGSISEDDIPIMLSKLVRSTIKDAGVIESRYLVTKAELDIVKGELDVAISKLREMEDSRDMIKRKLDEVRYELSAT